MSVKKLVNYEIHLSPGAKRNRVRKVTLTSGNITIYTGDEYDLTYEVNPKNAYYDEVEWTSSDSSIVDIDENGHITGKKDGVAKITIRIKSVSAVCYVTVKSIIHFKDPLVKTILVRNYDTDLDGEISYYEARQVTSIPFPMFTSMPIRTFDELKYFTNLKTIGQHAFDSCKKLTSITFPQSLEKINKNAFSYCDSLKTITIPSKVQSIGSEAFSFCDTFTTAYVKPTTPPKNGNEIFKNCPDLDRIIVPQSSTQDYLDAINWGMLDEDEYLYYSYIVQQCFDYTFNFFLS